MADGYYDPDGFWVSTGGYYDPDGYWVADTGSNFYSPNNPFTPSTDSSYSFDQLLKDAQKLFSGTSSLGNLGSLLGFGGVASLLNRYAGQQEQRPTGYQGGIPQYQVARQQYAFAPSQQLGTVTDDQIRRYVSQQGITDPMVVQNMLNYGVTPERMAEVTELPASDVSRRYLNAFGPNISEGYRRPGSGGITYFSPMQYVPVTTQPPATTAPPPPGTTPAATTTPNPNAFNNGGGGNTQTRATIASSANRETADGVASGITTLTQQQIAALSPAARQTYLAAQGIRLSPEEVEQYYGSGSSAAQQMAAAPATGGGTGGSSMTQAGQLGGGSTTQQAATQQGIASIATTRPPVNNPGYATRHTYTPGVNPERPAIADQFTNIEGGYYGFDPVYNRASGTSYFGDQLMSSVPGMKNPSLVLGAMDTTNWNPANKYVLALPGYREGADPQIASAMNLSYAPGGYQFQYDPENKNWFASGYINPRNQKGYLIDRFGNALERPVDFLTSAYTNTPTYQFTSPEARSYFPKNIYSSSEDTEYINPTQPNKMADGGEVQTPRPWQETLARARALGQNIKRTPVPSAAEARQNFVTNYGQLRFDESGIPLNTERREPHGISGRQEYANPLMESYNTSLRVFANEQARKPEFSGMPRYSENVQEYLEQLKNFNPTLFQRALEPLTFYRLRADYNRNPNAQTQAAIRQHMLATGWGRNKFGLAAGGVASLPAAKGRFVQGPGDGVSDHVPATIEGNQPARLADGEFVLPARIVSELGNGSSAAGARKLYAFMDRVERMTRKAKRGEPSGADKLLNKLA